MRKRVLTAIVLLFAMVSLSLCGLNISQPVTVEAATTDQKPGISKTKLNLDIGDTYKLSVKGTTAISYKSSKKSVAKVSKKGKITALKSGTAVIRVKCKNNKTYKCTVTVSGKLTAQEVYDKCCDSVVEIDAGEAFGTGFFIDEHTIVTNHHVIAGATKLSIVLRDGKKHNITGVKGYDRKLDIAILETDYSGKPLSLNSHGLATGETTYAIGSSLGLTDTFSGGMITNKERIEDGVKFIQTDAAISEGNSGGPLLNVYGEVIGITSSSYDEGQNLNYAVEITQIDKVDTSAPMSVKEYLNSSDNYDVDSDGTYDYLMDWLIDYDDYEDGIYFLGPIDDHEASSYIFYDSEYDNIGFELYLSDDTVSSLYFDYDGTVTYYWTYYKGDSDEVIAEISQTIDTGSFTQETKLNGYTYEGDKKNKAAYEKTANKGLISLISETEHLLDYYDVGIGIKDMGFNSFNIN